MVSLKDDKDHEIGSVDLEMGEVNVSGGQFSV